MLPKTMAWTFTAVPQEAGMSCMSRYLMARAFIQEPKTAPIAPQSCSAGSCGKGRPSVSCTSALYCGISAFQSSALRSVSRLKLRRSLYSSRMSSK